MEGGARMSVQTGAISGRVLRAGGMALPDTAVMLTGNSPGHLDIAARTNQRGEFAFRGLRAGLYTVLVNAAGFGTTAQPAHVQAGQQTTLVFELA